MTEAYVDASKRLALIREAEAIMEQDPPFLPVAWENINDVWYNYVKGRVSRTHQRERRCGAVREMREGPSRSVVSAGLKPLQAAAVKSDRGERCRKAGTRSRQV